MTNPILLILDLDETLIHSPEGPLVNPPDFLVQSFPIYLRPFLADFVRSVSSDFNLAVWSAASSDYVDSIVKQIIPHDVHLRFAWSGAKCSRRFDPETREHYKVKPLKKIKKHGFQLERTLIVDNTPSTARENYGNAIYVRSFEGDPNDNELECLSRYLHTLKNCENVRHIEKRGWRSKVEM